MRKYEISSKHDPSFELNNSLALAYGNTFRTIPVGN